MFMQGRIKLTLLIVMPIFSSCSTYRYIYSASPPNTPYFTKNGESKLTGYYSGSSENRLTGEYAHGCDLQGAYALSNHLAIGATYFYRKERDTYSRSGNLYDSSVIHYKRNLFDVDAGYFIPLNANKKSTFNIYAGIGGGKFVFNDNGIDKNLFPYTRFHKSAITKWFIQPSINFMPGRYMRFCFATKLSFVHYGKIETSYSQDEIQYFTLNKIADKTLGFFEPSFNFQFGIPKAPWVKIDFVLSTTSGYDSYGSHLNVRGSNASIGLNFDFSKL